MGKNVEKMLKITLHSKLRQEWAQEFYEFYNNPTLTVEEVVNKKYSKQDLPNNSHEKFVCMASLLSANENQVGACRNFIKKYCAPEYLVVYDITWMGNDEDRIRAIQALRTNYELEER